MEIRPIHNNEYYMKSRNEVSHHNDINQKNQTSQKQPQKILHTKVAHESLWNITLL